MSTLIIRICIGIAITCLLSLWSVWAGWWFALLWAISLEAGAWYVNDTLLQPMLKELRRHYGPYN